MNIIMHQLSGVARVTGANLNVAPPPHQKKNHKK